jgi:hypothetical protein
VDAEFDLDRWVARIRQALWVLAAAGTAGFAIGKGWNWAFSFLTGALIAIASFHLTHRFVMSIGATPSGKPGTFRMVLLGSRYLFIGAILALLAFAFDLNGTAALCGLLTPAAAVLFAMMLELPGWLSR